VLGQNGTVGEFWSLVPKSIRARTPDEVGTIVYISCRDESLGGTTASGDDAGVLTAACTAQLIDKQSHQLLGQKEFRAFEGSSRPPETYVVPNLPNMEPGQVIGSRPYLKIMAWLRDLPQS
jgi:hypothetical protein